MTEKGKRGDEWLFEGPGTYIPRKEVVVDETVNAYVLTDKHRLQQAEAQAQAKVAQAQAEAQAQAVQKQLQSGQKPPTSNVTVSQVAATTSSLAQPQLTQAGQARAQLAGKTVTRAIKNEELTAFLKRQQQQLASQSQKSQKTTTTAFTTLPLTTAQAQWAGGDPESAKVPQQLNMEVQQLATVRQQLQQQVKQSGTGAGATLSIQQAGKPVTIIPTVSGNSLLTVAKTMGGQPQTLPMTESTKQILTQLMSGGGTQNMAQLARVISQAQALAQKGSQSSGLQPQQTVTVQSVPGTQPSRGQGQASTSGAASVQVASSSQVTASIQPQGTIQSGSPVQVTPSAQTTKALSLSPAERQAALKSTAHRLVQQAQTQQAQIKQTGMVRRSCKRQLPRSSDCSNFKKRRGPTTAAATATTTTTAPSTSEPDVSVPDPNPGQLEPQTEAKPQSQSVPQPQPQPQATPPVREQAPVVVKTESPTVALPTATATAVKKPDTHPPASSPEPQQQAAQSKQQQPPTTAAPVRASPYAMRLRKPSNPSKE